MATISLPTLLVLLLCIHAATAFLSTPHRPHQPTTRRLAATTTTTAVESTKPARPMLDPRTLQAPALKQKILQLAAQMDRGKLQVGIEFCWVIWGFDEWTAGWKWDTCIRSCGTTYTHEHATNFKNQTKLTKQNRTR